MVSASFLAGILALISSGMNLEVYYELKDFLVQVVCSLFFITARRKKKEEEKKERSNDINILFVMSVIQLITHSPKAAKHINECTYIFLFKLLPQSRYLPG